jgi:hypothetical protein
LRLIIFAIVMSALPPRADMCSAATDVRFGPKADMAARHYSGFNQQSAIQRLANQ